MKERNRQLKKTSKGFALFSRSERVFTFLLSKKATPLLKVSNSGFTLIEVLIVMSIVVVLGFILTEVMTQSLRGQTKVKTINEVKQNGQVVLDKLSAEIRLAEKVICTDHSTTFPTDYDTLVIFGQNALVGTPSAQIVQSGYTRFRFYNSTPDANGYIASDTFDLPDAQEMLSVYGSLCSPQSPQSLYKNYLTDKSLTSGTSLARDGGTSVFQLNSQPGFNDLVTVTFRTFPGIRAGGTYETQVESGGVLFSTTIKARASK